MGKQVHRIHAFESRKISHPVFKHIDKYWLTVKATDFPSGISAAANAREPVGLNRVVYRDVRESLEGTGAEPGTFDLMNKGITILARSVRLIDKEEQIYEITVDDERGGIVDGAHTAKIIEQCNGDATTDDNQYVEVYVRTGIENGLITDIARGLNTGMQVAPKSIYNIDGVFDWLKKEVDGQPYENMIAWRESDNSPYDVRDLISILELFNVIDFPNDKAKHPISAYEKWSIPLKKFADDYEENSNRLKHSKYYRLRPLLHDALVLYDQIRHDFRDLHNEAGGRAGRMNIVDEAAKNRMLDFPFAQLEESKYRLTKGAAYPMLAAFRNMVEMDSSGNAAWRGGFRAVLHLWKEAGPELVTETYNATEEIGRSPDHLGKNRKHWDNLHMKIQLRLLRAQLEVQRSRRS
jgi:AIPR protein